MTATTFPLLFLGHGNPMNALQENSYTKRWQQLGQQLPKPKAIVVISAHWQTNGLSVTASVQPQTIHDFSGFPPALFAMHYPAAGSPELAQTIREILQPHRVMLDLQWGFDHGSWGILCKMYPAADIPVVQLSLDKNLTPSNLFVLGQQLSILREQGILLIASGNTVHNLHFASSKYPATGFDWAREYDDYVCQYLRWYPNAEAQPLTRFYQNPNTQQAHPTAEHFLPLLIILGALTKNDDISYPITGYEMGSISMLSLLATSGRQIGN